MGRLVVAASPSFDVDWRLLTPQMMKVQVVKVKSKIRLYYAQCFGQFGELEDWSQKLLPSVRRTELKEPEITTRKPS